MLTFVFHDFENTTTINFTNVLIVEVFVEPCSELWVSLLPFELRLLESVGIGEDLFAEGAFIIMVSLAHGLLVIFQVSVLDLFHILDRLKMHLLPSLPQTPLVICERTVMWCNNSRFAQVVAQLNPKQLHHHNYNKKQNPYTITLNLSALITQPDLERLRWIF